MLDIDFNSFREELKTAAANPYISGASSLGGIGAAAGGLLGGYRAYHKAREEGAEGGEAFQRALGGAGRGAIVGGVGGAALGAGAAHVLPSVGDAAARAPIIGAPARFAQRQVHGLTGWEPTGGIEAVRGGSHGAKNRLFNAKIDVEKAQGAVHAAQEAQDAGLTSIPGFVKGLAKDPKGTISKGFNEGWKGTSTGQKALMVGLPAYEAYKGAVEPESETGPGKAERIARGLVPATVGLATGGLPFAGQMAVGGATSALGGAAGRAVDRLRGRKYVPPPHKPEPPMGPVEVRATPEVMGGPGAGGGMTPGEMGGG